MKIWLVMLALVLSATQARAQVTGAQKEEARERFARGVERLKVDDYAGAALEFEKAYRLAPYPVIRFNLGLAYARLDRPVDAADTMQRVLDDPGNLAPARIAQAKRILAEQQKRIGELEIDVSEAGATVRIDGAEVGNAPLAKSVRVAAGTHYVEAVKHRFAPARREVLVGAGAREKLRLVLDPSEQPMAQLWIRSQLIDAEIWLDGTRIGTTPLNKSVPVLPGRHQVELRRKGYRTARESVDVGPGATAELSLVPAIDDQALDDEGGFLVFDADWANELSVSVDGQRRGRYLSPIQLPPGMHLVRVERSGFFPATLRIELAPGETKRQQLVLEPTVERIAEHETESSMFRGWAIGTTVVGTALLAAGVPFTIWSHLRHQELRDERLRLAEPDQLCDESSMNYTNNKAECDAKEEEAQRAFRLRPVGWAMLGVGGALVITGITLFVVGPDGDELTPKGESLDARLSPVLELDRHGGYLGVRGRF